MNEIDARWVVLVLEAYKKILDKHPEDYMEFGIHLEVLDGLTERIRKLIPEKSLGLLEKEK